MPPSVPGDAVAGPSQAEADEVLRQHFESSPVGMLVLSGDRTVLRANEAMSVLTGLSVSVLSGSPFRRFLSTDAPLDQEDRIFEMLEEAGCYLGELEIRTSIGDTSPMLVTITPVDGGSSSGTRPARPGTGSESARYVVTIFEWGSQRWAEAEASRRAAELAVLSSLAVATGESGDPQGMLTAVARVIVDGLEVDACWIHRYDAASGRIELAAEACHLNPSLRLSPHMIPDVLNPGVLRAVQNREQVTESELLDRSIATVVHVPLLARDEVVGIMSILSVEGEKLSTRNSDLLRATGYKVGTAIQNVRLLESVRVQQVELREKNEQLEALVSDLRKADRMKNEFLANTSHELRTPLNSIIGFLNLVVDGLCENEEEETELLTHALTSARHLLSLINDVLDLARIEAGRLPIECGEVDLAPLIDEVATTMVVQAKERGLALLCGQVPPGLRVAADESRLRQVLMNVTGNAIKFTPRGSVTLRIEAAEGSPFVEISVRDTGIGIDPEHRDRLFRKFSQVDNSTTRRFGGTGLGLVIVKELVERMGGTVVLESPGVGKGSTVTLSLPRAGTKAA